MPFQVPDYHEHEEFRNRSLKLQEIRAYGIDPYPPKFTPTHEAHSLDEMYRGHPVGHSEDASLGKTPLVCVAGRLVLFRAMGKNAFANIQDATGRIQVMCNREETKVEGFVPQEDLATPLKFLEKKIDLGDILGVEGYLFRTQKGELTIFAKKITLVCKTLLPLPDKHSGLADKGICYRKRWLDLITHADVIKRFELRSRILRSIRHYFDKERFLEVETPVLQNIYGGAEAQPFTTHLNALDQKMYLRIALEIALKKLVVGGMERIYEIGKTFRNEGIDRTHNPEFTMLEAYAAYWDYNDMMVFTENLFESLAQELFQSTELIIDGVTINLKAPWKRLSMKQAIELYGHLNVDSLSEEQMRAHLTHLDPKEIQNAPRGALIALLFEEYAEKHLIQPHHIIDHPIETTPLAKLHRDPTLRQERFVERFESFILGGEFCNSYTELNDPELQRALLVQQAEKKLHAGEETHLDEDFIEAICQGMPPTAGLGIGIDRLVMLFSGVSSIRDVLYFPLVSKINNHLEATECP